MTLLRTMNGRRGLGFPIPTALVCLALLCCAPRAVAQTQPSPTTQTQPDTALAAQPTQATSAPDNTNLNDSLEKPTEDPRNVLGAPQIIDLAQQNPEVILELKSLVADLAQAKGIPSQADGITDEQLFSQIAASIDLRASITRLLEARGYISEEDVEIASKENADRNDNRISGGTADRSADAGFENRLKKPDTTNATGVNENLAGQSKLDNQQTPSQTSTADQRQETKVQPNITDEPKSLHREAPYNLLSLRDLYTQIPDSPEKLKRFGAEVFTHRGAATDYNHPSSAVDSMPLDVPLGPDYVLGPGDELSISLWGGVSESFIRPINREGAIMLPEAGQVQVAGLTLGNAQAAIGSALQPQFRNAHVAVTLARLRTIRIYVVGDVQRPGAYDISSLASPLSALYAAGGPTAIGSLRVMHHMRNGNPIGDIDLYDFLLHGIRNADDHLQGGDTLLIPPAGPQVAIYGAVKRPAIYELRAEKNLAAGLEDAGGFTVAAELSHITIERIVANQRRETVPVQAPASIGQANEEDNFANVELKDGDRVRVGTVLPSSERVVYLQGHVGRPGKLAYRDGLHLADVLQSYRDLLPEPAARGEIVRLVAPDLHPETINFNLPDVLIGNSNPPLQPFDTIRIFGRYERDSPNVSIQGEVQHPGSYPMFDGMTAAQLVRAAGGFKRDASLQDADLISYHVVNDSGVTIERRTVSIGAAVLQNNAQADSSLQPGDVLTIHQLTGWNDIGASILIQGEVAHPGSYGFTEGEHLSDVLKRAGGLRPTAYPEGAVLTRPEVRALEEKSREELIRQIETSSAAARMSPGLAGSDQAATLQLIQQQQDEVLSRLRSQPASGRLVIHIDGSIDQWAGTEADIEVRKGDVLRIPKRPGFVLISGQVYNASAITFIEGKTAGWYLERAGGATTVANRKEIFVIRANGSVVGRRSGEGYDHNVLSTRLDPGDVIVVPQKIVGASVVWRNILGAGQIAASLAIAAAVGGLF
jgi:protein involved in polysaccharide export with SLBB domain